MKSSIKLTTHSNQVYDLVDDWSKTRLDNYNPNLNLFFKPNSNNLLTSIGVFVKNTCDEDVQTRDWKSSSTLAVIAKQELWSLRHWTCFMPMPSFYHFWIGLNHSEKDMILMCPQMLLLLLAIIHVM